jgi:hypothetical protein
MKPSRKRKKAETITVELSPSLKQEASRKRKKTETTIVESSPSLQQEAAEPMPEPRGMPDPLPRPQESPLPMQAAASKHSAEEPSRRPSQTDTITLDPIP